MESHMAMTMEGYLEAVLHVFAFIHQKYNPRVVFDPTYFAIDMNYFKDGKCKNFMVN